MNEEIYRVMARQLLLKMKQLTEDQQSSLEYLTVAIKEIVGPYITSLECRVSELEEEKSDIEGAMWNAIEQL